MNEAQKKYAELRDMLIKTHTRLGIAIYFQGSDGLPTYQEWEALSDEKKQNYCKWASKIAGIDHEKYLEILKKRES